MALLLVLLFVVAPVAELAVIVVVAQNIGVLDTIGLLVLVSVVGAWLAKHQGLGILARVRATFARGEVPNRELLDGGLVLLAGALLVLPGFISDVLALVLLVPPTRALVRGAVIQLVRRHPAITVVAGARSTRRDDVWDVESWEQPARRPGHRELGGPR